MNSCNPARTPGIGKELIADPEGSVQLEAEGVKDYQAIIGSLAFLTECTRIDITFAVSLAVRFYAQTYHCPHGEREAQFGLSARHAGSVHFGQA